MVKALQIKLQHAWIQVVHLNFDQVHMKTSKFLLRSSLNFECGLEVHCCYNFQEVTKKCLVEYFVHLSTFLHISEE